MRSFDVCVLTAANDKQADGYRKQLEWRRKNGMLPPETEFVVSADPDGKRVGSGASTIQVLHQLLERAEGKFDDAFRSRRILILHSGGDSRRLPAYSAMGKVFAPLPTEKFFAVFDATLDSLMRLPVMEEGQVIVASGDVVLVLEADYLAFSPRGVTGVAYPDQPQIASGHGVYLVADRASRAQPTTVADFLQKPSLEELQAAHALDATGRALVDTGVFNLAPDAIEGLLRLPGVYERILSGELFLDIYKEVPFALLGKGQRPELGALAEIPFAVSQLPYCGFFHFGRSRQLLDSLYTLTHAGLFYDFQNFTRVAPSPCPRAGEAFVYNAVLDLHQVTVHGPSLIEGSALEGDLRLDGENLLTGLPEGSGDIALEKGRCLTMVPVEETEWAAVIYGLDDDFKRAFGEEASSFMGEELADWMNARGLAPEELWRDAEPRELWSARLFPVSNDPGRAAELVLRLQNRESHLNSWRASRRQSLNEILQAANGERILEGYTRLQKRTRLANLSKYLTPDRDLSAEEVLSWCQDSSDWARLVRDLSSWIERAGDRLFQARLCRLLATARRRRPREADTERAGPAAVCAEPGPEELDRRAYGLVRETVAAALDWEPAHSSPQRAIRSDEVVWVRVPVRLDFAGGWSDTPPYCLERGGSVLNAAVTLNGQYPVQAIVKLNPEPGIRINSIDLGASTELSTMAELLSFCEPGDWLSLPKAAFVAAGIVPRDERLDLRDFLGSLGGGVDLTLFSAVPSGSGLGTSSILGSAVISSLARTFGLPLTQNELYNRTLYMEQLMTTGGGWQDQIGGVVGGVKLIQTEPGLAQSPRISWTDLRQTGVPLSDRFLLYYTGYRRLAKNILHDIVGKYLDRDRGTVETIDRLRGLSLEMKSALDERDLDAFGRMVGGVWDLNKRMDPGTSNEEIEAILSQIRDHLLGAKLLGAGGGGFLFIVTPGPDSSQRVRQILTNDPPNARARFFDFAIDDGGLNVSVL